jgi:hypothetical protein
MTAEKEQQITAYHLPEKNNSLSPRGRGAGGEGGILLKELN